MKITEMNGHVDGVLANAIVGWARNPQKPTQTTEIVIVCEDKIVGRTHANSERQDLAELGLEDGKHGFAWSIPRRFSDGNEHIFNVVSLDDRKALLNSPVHFKGQSITASADAGLPIEAWLNHLKEEGVLERMKALLPDDAVAYLYIMILGRLPEPAALIGSAHSLAVGDTTIEKMAESMVNSEERRSNKLLQVPTVDQVDQVINDYTGVLTKFFRKRAMTTARILRS